MEIITAPDASFGKENGIKCFLAGGITQCPDWQYLVANTLRAAEEDGAVDLKDLVLFNPRQLFFDVNNPNGAQDQVKWEFDRLQSMDIFSMFFCESVSIQPICMYELGRNLLAMHLRFPNDWKDRTVISCDSHYSRWRDVEIQSKLAGFSNVNIMEDYQNLIITHCQQIIYSYNHIKRDLN